MMVRDGDGPADGASGSRLEVFMLRRTGRAAFGAGMYVFPGGKVDDLDHAIEVEPFCRGLDDAAASAQLGLRAGGLAFWVAAIRECFEETGILLASRRDGGVLEVRDDDRHAVHDGTLSMVDLCRRDDLVLDLSTTEYVDHWITPLGEQRRFDTRFFVTDAPDGQEGLHDDKETVDSLWVRPEDALRMHEAGELQIMPPTKVNLEWLARFDAADDAVAAGKARTDIEAVLPKLRRDADGRVAGVARQGDDDYHAITVDDPELDRYLAASA
jgi:8-oxo-dGTP pyrophosphatase MutT (NUDIX family)